MSKKKRKHLSEGSEAAVAVAVRNRNKLVQPDPDVAFEFTPDCIKARRLAR